MIRPLGHDLKEEGRRLNRNHVVNGCLSTVEPYKGRRGSSAKAGKKLHTVINEKTDVGEESQ